MNCKNIILCVFTLLIISLFPSNFPYATDKPALSEGETIYVPAYSHIYSGNKETPYMLSVTLSIRNIDLNHQMEIILADYYETQGKLLRQYVETPIILKPLESLRYVISEKDESGGSGANFIVKWKSDKPINPPVVESIMIGRQGVSFTSRGQVLVVSE